MQFLRPAFDLELLRFVEKHWGHIESFVSISGLVFPRRREITYRVRSP
jgi:hypothetical protein